MKQEPKTTVEQAAPKNEREPKEVPFFARYLESVPRVNSGLRAGRRA